MYHIQTLNKISAAGLKRLDPEHYQVSDSQTNPEGIMVRSAKLLDMDFPSELLAIARAGVGAGDGTVIINDDDNPLANNAGQDTTTERTIEDNENPLASGALAQNPFAMAGIVLAVLAVIGVGAYLFIRRRNKKATDKMNA